MQATKALGVPPFDLSRMKIELLRPLLPSVDYFHASSVLVTEPPFSGRLQSEAIGHFFLARRKRPCILDKGQNGSWLIGRDGGPQ